MIKYLEKYASLVNRLKQYQKISVAYSGGVDSTLLVKAACDAIGKKNVTVYHGVSCFIPKTTSHLASQLISRYFGKDISFKKIELDPLGDEHVKRNSPERCYYCKKKLYLRLLEENSKEKISIILDGTNLDDLSKNRPGAKAISELEISTPFIESRIGKVEIRKIAGHFGLPNADLPSDSCLATRLAENHNIHKKDLEKIERFESFLIGMNLTGCRVRPRDNSVTIELIESDFVRIADKKTREEIVAYFQGNGFEKITLSLYARR